MAAIIIGSGPNAAFGQLTNQISGRLVNLNASIARLEEAIVTASAGYDGIAGTQFEAPASGTNMGVTTNLFAVLPDPAVAGKQGSDYRYAVEQLAAQWQTFWDAAAPYLAQIDNGSQVT